MRLPVNQFFFSFHLPLSLSLFLQYPFTASFRRRCFCLPTIGLPLVSQWSFTVGHMLGQARSFQPTGIIMKPQEYFFAPHQVHKLHCVVPHGRTRNYARTNVKLFSSIDSAILTVNVIYVCICAHSSYRQCNLSTASIETNRNVSTRTIQSDLESWVRKRTVEREKARTEKKDGWKRKKRERYAAVYLKVVIRYYSVFEVKLRPRA